jgi:IclR family acetate operon transcriptional repressor
MQAKQETRTSRNVVRADRDIHLVRSVGKAVQLLQHVADAPRPLSARELAAAAGIPVSTTYQLLETLLDSGILWKESRGRYELGPGMARLASAFSRRAMPPRSLLVAVHELAEKTRESAHVTTWKWDELTLLAAVEKQGGVPVKQLLNRYGGHVHARASGKVMLAYDDAARDRVLASGSHLDALTPKTITSATALHREIAAVRARGYALDQEECIRGICCISAPISDGSRVLAALTVTVPADQFAQRREELIAEVVGAARQATARAAVQPE